MSRINRTSVGEVEITVLNDGALDFPADVFAELSEPEAAELLAGAGKTAIQTNFNALHIRSQSRSVLVDAGAREFFGPTAGFFGEAMKEAEIREADITHLVITHLHPDHIGGTLTVGGEPVFPGAEFFVSDREYRHWTDDGNFVGADDHATEWRKLALDVLNAYGDRVTTVGADGEIVPGMRLLDLPGHTPGHAGLQIGSGRDQFIYAADILHAQDLQLARPEICAVFDADKEQAICSRQRLMDMLATDRIMFSGSHFLDCVIGYVEKSGDGFRIVPG